MSTFKQDPEKYAAMAEPFESEAEAGAAIGAFLEKVTQLRESYRIAEVVICVGVYLPSTNTDELKGLTSFQTFGNRLNSFKLADDAAVYLAREIARSSVDNAKTVPSEEFQLTPEPMDGEEEEKIDETANAKP